MEARKRWIVAVVVLSAGMAVSACQTSTGSGESHPAGRAADPTAGNAGEPGGHTHGTGTGGSTTPDRQRGGGYGGSQ